MARQLADVLHHWLPAERATRPPAEQPGQARVVVPVAPRDVLRAAFAMNLAYELARRGAPPVLVAPAEGDALAWASAEPGALGVELVRAPAGDLACVLKERGFGGERRRTPVLVATPRPEDLPRAWRACGGSPLVLLFATPEPGDTRAAVALLEALRTSGADFDAGVTVHGVASVAEAASTFEALAAAAEPHLERPLLSYGLLVDDLHVYRAIVRRRPVGVEQPQSPAARAFADVARLLSLDLGLAGGSPPDG